MSLRKKTLLIIGIAFVVLVASLIVAAQLVVTRGFGELEAQDTRLNVKRAMSEIANKLDGLSRAVGDWAPWDDTYFFVQDHNEDYIRVNLTTDTLVNLGVNFTLFIDSSGKLVNIAHVDLLAKEDVSAPVGLVDMLLATPSLVQHADTESSQAGIVMTASGPVMVASKPILKSDLSGPIKGALIFGKYLNASEVEQLGKITHLSLAIHPFDDARMPPDFSTAKSAFSKENAIVIRPLNENTIAGYGLQEDIHGKPAFLVKVEIPRNIYRHGRHTLLYYMGSLLSIGLVFIALIMIFLEKVVLSPLSRLSDKVSEIGESSDLSQTLPVLSRDELGNLSGRINDMLVQLKETREKLQEQSYRSGMAEMAAGVLHNVRNSLNPLVGHIELLRSNLKKAPIQQIERAQKELSEGVVSEERRADLTKLLTLSNTSLVQLTNETKTKLDDAVERIVHIEQILDDHQKWAHSEAPNEKLQIDGLIQESIKLVHNGFKDTISIYPDPGIAEVGTVAGHRITLVQVFENVLLNAVESIRRKGPEPGEIHIQAAIDPQNSKDMLHVQIRDNGEGIEPEMLKHIFERGYSTKETKSSGIGLHWCANVISATHGHIYAESEGPGKGACVHLLLPSAHP